MRMVPTKLAMMRMTDDGMGRVRRIFVGVRGELRCEERNFSEKREKCSREKCSREKCSRERNKMEL